MSWPEAFALVGVCAAGAAALWAYAWMEAKGDAAHADFMKELAKREDMHWKVTTKTTTPVDQSKGR